MTMFNLDNRLQRGVAAVLAVGVLGGGAVVGIAAASGGHNSSKPAPAPATTKRNGATATTAKRSTVPASLTRAETAAEDVITYLLEQGRTTTSPPSPALSRAEAKTLKQLAHGQVAVELAKAGVPQSKIQALQQRADRVTQLSGDRQHCSVHRARNPIAKLPEQDRERVRCAYWKALDEAKDERDGKEQLEALVDELERAGYASAARCLADDLDALVVHLRYPLRHRKRWRSTNLLERTLGEVKRRTKVIGRFSGEESCLSLVWAVLDLQINNACNGVKLSDIDRQRLYRLRHEPESEAERKEVAAA